MATKDDDHRNDYRGKDSKEVARPKDETGPYVPDKRSYYAGLALGGMSAGAALHRAGSVAALAVKLGDAMVEELRKPPPLPDEELKAQQAEQLAAERERAEKDRLEQEKGRKQQDEEVEKLLTKQREDNEKAEKAERERQQRHQAPERASA